MRTILAAMAVLLCACGGEELDGSRVDGLVEKQQQAHALIGSYTFGRLVKTPRGEWRSELQLTVERSGTFSVWTPAGGCLPGVTFGTWSAGARGLVLQLGEDEAWAEAIFKPIFAKRLDMAPTLGGVIISGRTIDGVDFAQSWADAR